MRAAVVIVGLWVLAFAPLLAVADDGEAASRRAAELLAQSTVVDPAVCGVQLLGLYAKDRLVGFMRSVLERGNDAVAPGYAFSLEAELVVAAATRMVVRSAGRFGANLSPIEAEGEDRRTQGEQMAAKTYAYRRADGAYAWTGRGQRSAAESRAIEGPADVVMGIDFLFARRWVALPAGTRYRFRALNGDRGRIEVVEITRGATRAMEDGGVMRDVVDLKVVKLEGDDAGDFVCDPSGRILSGALAGSPYALRAITPEQLEAWRHGPSDAKAGSGS